VYIITRYSPYITDRYIYILGIDIYTVKYSKIDIQLNISVYEMYNKNLVIISPDIQIKRNCV